MTLGIRKLIVLALVAALFLVAKQPNLSWAVLPKLQTEHQEQASHE